MLRVGSSLIGYKILIDDGKLGTVSDLLFDDTTWNLRWLVVDTGNWLPGRKVLIHPAVLGRPDDGDESLAVHLTRKQIEASPNVSRDRPVSRQAMRDVYSYYAWDPAWGDSYFGAGSFGDPIISPYRFDGDAARAMEGAVVQDDGDPHLRSSAELKGYHIHATDGDIGHIENLLIDDTRWGVRYLIVDTSNWLFGRHVLISPFAVRGINWSERLVSLGVNQARVKSSPPWNPVELVEMAYQRRLHQHYDWPGYGW